MTGAFDTTTLFARAVAGYDTDTIRYRIADRSYAGDDAFVLNNTLKPLT